MAESEKNTKKRRLSWHEGILLFANLDGLSLTPGFSDLATMTSWPTPVDLSKLLQSIHNHDAVTFVPAKPKGSRFRRRRLESVPMAYEKLIATNRNVPTRQQNWHDFFNAISWLGFPKSKYEIARLHCWFDEKKYADDCAHESKEKVGCRSPERDALTLFDEGGVAVFCQHQVYQKILDGWLDQKFSLQDYVANELVLMRIFGHALYEHQLLNRQSDIGACGILVPCSEQLWRDMHVNQDVPVSARTSLVESARAMDKALCNIISTRYWNTKTFLKVVTCS